MPGNAATTAAGQRIPQYRAMPGIADLKTVCMPNAIVGH